MTVDERTAVIDHLTACEHNMAELKGKAYSGDGDVLANFKRNAERLGLSRFQVWAVYFNKHIDAINNAIAQNPITPVDRSEGLGGRLLDARVYLGLLECLLNEE